MIEILIEAQRNAVFAKCYAVVESCTTLQHFEAALRYIELAQQIKLLNLDLGSLKANVILMINRLK